MASRDSPGFFAQWGGMVQRLKTIPYGQKSGRTPAQGSGGSPL